MNIRSTSILALIVTTLICIISQSNAAIPDIKLSNGPPVHIKDVGIDIDFSDKNFKSQFHAPSSFKKSDYIRKSYGTYTQKQNTKKLEVYQIDYTENDLWSKQLTKLNSDISNHPENARLYYYRGITHFYLKHFGLALIDIRIAIKLDPSLESEKSYEKGKIMRDVHYMMIADAQYIYSIATKYNKKTPKEILGIKDRKKINMHNENDGGVDAINATTKGSDLVTNFLKDIIFNNNTLDDPEDLLDDDDGMSGGVMPNGDPYAVCGVRTTDQHYVTQIIATTARINSRHLAMDYFCRGFSLSMIYKVKDGYRDIMSAMNYSDFVNTAIDDKYTTALFGKYDSLIKTKMGNDVVDNALQNMDSNMQSVKDSLSSNQTLQNNLINADPVSTQSDLTDLYVKDPTVNINALKSNITAANGNETQGEANISNTLPSMAISQTDRAHGVHYLQGIADVLSQVIGMDKNPPQTTADLSSIPSGVLQYSVSDVDYESVK